MKKQLVLIGFVLVALLSCKPNTKEKEGTVSNTPDYPAIPLEDFQTLLELTARVDYIFYNMNFSTNVEGPSAQAAAAFFTGSAAPGGQNCAEFGRAFYNDSEGRELIQADIYFSNGCAHYVFIKNKEKVYSSTMTDNAKAFFNQMLSMKTASPRVPQPNQ